MPCHNVSNSSIFDSVLLTYLIHWTTFIEETKWLLVIPNNEGRNRSSWSWVLTFQWFEIMLTGTKCQEFRGIKPSWINEMSKLKKGDKIQFLKGYSLYYFDAIIERVQLRSYINSHHCTGTKMVLTYALLIVTKYFGLFIFTKNNLT